MLIYFYYMEVVMFIYFYLTILLIIVILFLCYAIIILQIEFLIDSLRTLVKSFLEGNSLTYLKDITGIYNIFM